MDGFWVVRNAGNPRLDRSLGRAARLVARWTTAFRRAASAHPANCSACAARAWWPAPSAFSPTLVAQLRGGVGSGQQQLEPVGAQLRRAASSNCCIRLGCSSGLDRPGQGDRRPAGGRRAGQHGLSPVGHDRHDHGAAPAFRRRKPANLPRRCGWRPAPTLPPNRQCDWLPGTGTPALRPSPDCGRQLLATTPASPPMRHHPP